MFTARLSGSLLALLACARIAVGQETGSIAGRVSSSTADSTPVIALISVDQGALNVQTDPEGRFRFTGLTPGKHFLLAKRMGHEPLRRAILVQSGRETTVELVFSPLAIELAELTVIGTRADLEERRARLAQVPGSVALIESDEIQRTRQANLKDVLGFTPGVYVQPRFGAADESQISIRGSGLRNNFHLRGINVLVNGMPYRNADGFTDFESLELLNTESIEVYKGGNALRYGGSTLGGAINLETKTGYTASPVGVGRLGIRRVSSYRARSFNRPGQFHSRGLVQWQASSRGCVLRSPGEWQRHRRRRGAGVRIGDRSGTPGGGGVARRRCARGV